jgi:hypothetical protein
MRVPPHVHLVVSLAVAACSVAAVVAQPSNDSDARIKAAFVSKFPQYVEWPAAALAGRQSLALCLAPPDPFGTDLDELVTGEFLNGRPIVVRRIINDDDVDRCHVLVVSSRTGGLREPFMRRAKSVPVLTVGDDAAFLDQGGMIRLRVVGGRVRFDVNVDAMRAVGLKVSSQLLQLALTVKGATR